MKTQTQTQPQAPGLFAALALASLACASFSVWVVAQVAAEQWMALRPEIYGALLQFMWRGVIA
jgi:hypothetical protein